MANTIMSWMPSNIIILYKYMNRISLYFHANLDTHENSHSVSSRGICTVIVVADKVVLLVLLIIKRKIRIYTALYRANKDSLSQGKFTKV